VDAHFLHLLSEEEWHLWWRRPPVMNSSEPEQPRRPKGAEKAQKGQRGFSFF